MAYIDFPEGLENQKKRKAFWLSDDGLTLIAGWRRNGVPLTEIAEKNIGISKTAFWGWYRQSDALRRACANSKDIADYTVEDALYRRAVGYNYEEKIFELVEGEVRLTKILEKHLPPDTKAIMHYLFNRKPEAWRAVQEPLDSTQYAETIKSILVAMKEVAEGGKSQTVEICENGGEIG